MKAVDVGTTGKKKLDAARNAYWDEILAKSPTYGAQLRTALEPYTKPGN
jgi:hypothetical protein